MNGPARNPAPFRKPLGRAARKGNRVRPFSLRTEMAAHLAQRDGDACQLCAGPFTEGLALRTLDHIIPRARGGTDHPANLRLAHFLCNHQRGCPEPRAGERKRIQRAIAGISVAEAWRAAGVDLSRRRWHRRSGFVRDLRRAGALHPGEVVFAIAALFEAER